MLAKSAADMLKLVRWTRDQHSIPPSRIWNFDEVRIYATPQDLHSHTLEFSSVRDPCVKKVANPKEAYTGIVMANGDGENLMIFLVTKKKIPPEFVVHTLTLHERSWENNEVKITPIEINFAVIHGITVLKVPSGRKAWCSSLITEAYLRLALFRVDEHSILQVNI